MKRTWAGRPALHFQKKFHYGQRTRAGPREYLYSIFAGCWGRRRSDRGVPDYGFGGDLRVLAEELQSVALRWVVFLAANLADR